MGHRLKVRGQKAARVLQHRRVDGAIITGLRRRQKESAMRMTAPMPRASMMCSRSLAAPLHLEG
jgi:hypothetical protein